MPHDGHDFVSHCNDEFSQRSPDNFALPHGSFLDTPTSQSLYLKIVFLPRDPRPAASAMSCDQVSVEDPRIFCVPRATHVPEQINVRKILECERNKRVSVWQLGF